MDASLETNHIALLFHQAKASGNTVLFKLPIRTTGSEPPLQWKDVTFAEFAANVNKVAAFVATKLTARDIPPRSVVTLLFSGYQYQHVVYAIALARASYVPQLISGDSLTTPRVIFSLAEQAGSKIILYDLAYEDRTADCPYPKMILNPIEAIESRSSIDSDAALPQIEHLSSDGSDLAFISLTSGSTSGSPKLVPFTQKSISAQHNTEFGRLLDGKSFDSTQDTFPARGNICWSSQLVQYVGCLYTKSCIVMPSKTPYSTEELSNMVSACGLNHIATFGTWLLPHIQAAKNDPMVLKLLQDMRTISYGGTTIPVGDDEWCFQHGIPLIDMYGTGECGNLMVSLRGKPSRFMRPARGVSCRFDPAEITPRARIDDPTSSPLLTFIILADSPQIPTGTHLLSADGNFHTRDLFERQFDGSYLFRGRNDDWIKSDNASFIDTKTIEEKFYELCGDLVTDYVIVGHHRPSPALFIEVQDLREISEDSLKESLLRRMEGFNASQYVHEKITDKRLIYIVEEGALPRTNKRNFKRKAIEEKYRKELDAAYLSVYTS